jgi:hypothetical protein
VVVLEVGMCLVWAESIDAPDVGTCRGVAMCVVVVLGGTRLVWVGSMERSVDASEVDTCCDVSVCVAVLGVMRSGCVSTLTELNCGDEMECSTDAPEIDASFVGSWRGASACNVLLGEMRTGWASTSTERNGRGEAKVGALPCGSCSETYIPRNNPNIRDCVIRTKVATATVHPWQPLAMSLRASLQAVRVCVCVCV